MANEEREVVKKKVPLVMYDEHGRRNEIGEAEVEVWPGEVRVHGTIDESTITGVIPMFFNDDAFGPYHK